jgi:hypothetical protein
MKLHIKVTHSGQARTVETSLAIIVAWERKYKKRAGDLAGGFAVEDLAFMAWQAGYKKEHGDFDKWLEQLEDLEVIDSRESHPTE